MHLAKILVAVGVVGALGIGAMAGFGPDEKAKPKNASSKASAATLAKFDKIKSLAGVWQGDENKDGEPDATIIYRLVSGGNAVAEFMLPGTDHEMVTMYHLDGDSIIATHYCSLGNQPRMRSKAGGGAESISFEFIDGTNMLSPSDMHIHSLTMAWKDADHITAAWSAQDDGKPSPHSPTFALTRVKDAEKATKIATTSLSCCGTGAAACCEAGKGEKTEKTEKAK
jgi:hypothetical protein